MPTSPEKSIFLTALEKDSKSERTAFIAEACAGDEQLRASVSRLLQAHEQSDNPLDELPAELRAGPGATLGDDPLVDSDSPSPHVGVGPYKLMEQMLRKTKRKGLQKSFFPALTGSVCEDVLIGR